MPSEMAFLQMRNEILFLKNQVHELECRVDRLLGEQPSIATINRRRRAMGFKPIAGPDFGFEKDRTREDEDIEDLARDVFNMRKEMDDAIVNLGREIRWAQDRMDKIESIGDIGEDRGSGKYTAQEAASRGEPVYVTLKGWTILPYADEGGHLVRIDIGIRPIPSDLEKKI